MSPVPIVATIVRLFSICLVVYVIQIAVMAVSLAQVGETVDVILFSWFAALLVLFVAIFLWKFPLWIARKLTEISTDSNNEAPPMSADDFSSTCFFALGIYFLYSAVGEMVYWFNFFNDSQIQELRPELTMDQVASLWGLAVRIIIILFLLVGNRKLVKLIKWLRSAG